MTEGKYKRIVLIAAIIAVASLGTAGVILGTRGPFQGIRDAAGSVTIDEEKSYTISGIESIKIFSTSADIKFIKTDERSIRVHLHGTIKTTNTERIPILDEQSSGKQLTVGSQPPRTFNFQSGKVSLSVYLPETYLGKMAVHSVSGEVFIPFGKFESLSLDSTSGDISINNVEADTIKVKTTSGDVSAPRISTGRLTLDTTSGDMSAAGVLGEVEAESTSGQIELSYDAFDQKADIKGTSGDVQISLPADASFYFKGRSTSGDVNCAFPITLDESSSGGGKNSLAGKVKRGGPEITIRTVSGDIDVRK